MVCIGAHFAATAAGTRRSGHLKREKSFLTLQHLFYLEKQRAVDMIGFLARTASSSARTSPCGASAEELERFLNSPDRAAERKDIERKFARLLGISE
jgi:hypothetical protein